MKNYFKIVVVGVISFGIGWTLDDWCDPYRNQRNYPWQKKN